MKYASEKIWEVCMLFEKILIKSQKTHFRGKSFCKGSTWFKRWFCPFHALNPIPY